MKNILKYLKYKLCDLIKYLMAQLLYFEVILVRYSPTYPYQDHLLYKSLSH